MRKLNDCADYQNIREIINYMCSKWPENKAFTLKNKVKDKVEYTDINFKQYKDEINYVGTALKNLNIKDMRVAIIGINSYPWAVSFLAATTCDAIAIPLDKGLPDEEIEMSLIRSHANVIVFDSKYKEALVKMMSEGKTELKHFICIDDEDMKDFESKVTAITVTTFKEFLDKGKDLFKKDKSFTKIKIDNDKTCEIVFTSGTTSQSKMVELSNKNVAANVAGLNKVETIYDTDTTICLLPYHHTFGSTGLLFMQSNGARAVFCDGLRYIQDNFIEYGVTTFIGVPLLIEAMDKKIWAKAEKTGKAKIVKIAMKVTNALRHIGIDLRQKVYKEIHENLGKLRFIVSGAAALDPKVARDFDAWGFLVAQGYGLTETSPVISGESDKEHRFGSVGMPLPGIEARIDNPDENGIGEICVKGPSVMKGYYDNKEATDEVLVDGWFHTGDLGRIDKKGYIFITGRKKNVIVLKNGKNVFPEEQETLLNQKDYCVESLVFGKPDKDDDLLISVEIQYDKDYFKDKLNMTDEKEIYDYIWEDIKKFNTTVPRYKHIKKLYLTADAMIKTSTAKTKRNEEIKKILANED
jgi:long-chain acyl-CoA synthetase